MRVHQDYFLKSMDMENSIYMVVKVASAILGSATMLQYHVHPG